MHTTSDNWSIWAGIEPANQSARSQPLYLFELSQIQGLEPDDGIEPPMYLSVLLIREYFTGFDGPAVTKRPIRYYLKEKSLETSVP